MVIYEKEVHFLKYTKVGNWYSKKKLLPWEKAEFLAQEKVTIILFKLDTYQKSFNEVGFDFQGINNDKSLVIYNNK